MNGRAIPGAYLFRLYVCDKEMSWPHHIGENGKSFSLWLQSGIPTKLKWTDFVPWLKTSVWITLKTFWKKRSSINFGQIFDFSFSKETEASYWRLTLTKLWKFGRRIVKTLRTYFQFNSIKCIIYFQYNSVKIVSFSFHFPLSFIQLGSCSSQPLVSFCPFIVCFILIYKTYL